MSRRVVAALLSATILASIAACSGDEPPPQAAPSVTASTAPPAYDASLEAAAAVLPLVPEAATTLLVTDYDAVRADQGLDLLTTASPVGEQDAFWAQAEAAAPLLSPGLLRSSEGRLRADYGLSQTDVAWEAHFLDDTGAELGWVLAVRDSTIPTSVERAVADGVGPLAGSTWRATDRIVVKGTTDDGSASWAASPELTALVGLPADATYVQRGCDADASAGAASAADLEPLTAFSVQFERTLVTARLGPGRLDLFDRLRTATASSRFALAYEGGVADPSTGRLGFRMTDPARAATLARTGRLPFTGCGSE